MARYRLDSGTFQAKPVRPIASDETSMSASPYLTLHELVKKARQNLGLNDWDYIVGGTETETTLRRNRLALDTIAFRPRVLRDVSDVDPSTIFMGSPLRMPVVLAPVGSLELFTPGGGATAAKAANESGVAHMLSSVAELPLEDIAAAAPEAVRIYQIYVNGDADWLGALAERAIRAGYRAICVTVDSAVYSRRERDIAKRNLRRQSVPGREYQATLTWADIARLKKRLTVPLMLKGIMTAEDASIAMEHGVDAVYVSNHGGRQLDHGLGAMDALPEIVAAVAGRAKIVIDGGFTRGTDIVKAIASGADLVGIGRMQCIGLAAGGQAGLVRVLELLEREVRDCMALLGVTRWSQLDASYLQRAAAVEAPRALSAFPLLGLDEGTFY